MCWFWSPEGNDVYMKVRILPGLNLSLTYFLSPLVSCVDLEACTKYLVVQKQCYYNGYTLFVFHHDISCVVFSVRCDYIIWFGFWETLASKVRLYSNFLVLSCPERDDSPFLHINCSTLPVENGMLLRSEEVLQLNKFGFERKVHLKKFVFEVIYSCKIWSWIYIL